MSWWKKDCSGKIVIEAAVIVPLIVLFILELVYILFFLCDMSAVKSETIIISQEMAAHLEDQNPPKTNSEIGRMKGRIKKKLLISDLKDCSVNISVDSVIVKAKISFPFVKNSFSFCSTSKAVINNREKWMRWLGRKKE